MKKAYSNRAAALLTLVALLGVQVLLQGSPAAFIGTNRLSAGSTNNTRARVEATSAFATKKTAALIESLKHALDSGRHSTRIALLLKMIEDRREVHRIPAHLLLRAYYRTSRKQAYAILLKKNPDLLTLPGRHRLPIALEAYAAGRFSDFLKHIAASLTTARRHRERSFRQALLAIQRRSFSKALKILKGAGKGKESLSKRLTAYIYIATEQYTKAYTLVKKLFAHRVDLNIQTLRLLFHLSLKLKSGIESVYWSKQMLSKASGLLRNPVFINNRCMALARLTQQTGDKKKKLKTVRELLKMTETLLQLKRNANTLHTASISYESAGNLQKAVEMIKLCRALAPKKIEFLKRQKKLEKALQLQSRKAGRE